MKRYAKQVSCDKRGQLVIPKEVRKEISVEEGTAFWVFLFENEGILLKRIDDEILDYNDPVIEEVSSKSDKLGIEKKNIDRTVQNYMRKEKGGFKEV